MEPAARGGEDERLFGVSLAQYAAVQAGLAEGLELDAVLVREGVPPVAWEAADGAWSIRLVNDLESNGTLQEAFDARFIDAQQRYVRRISPLDDDLAAWLGFVRHWSCDAEPLALLARLGMQPCDVIRLHRAWSQRLARDPALRKRAQELLQAEPSEMVAVQVEPAALSSSPPPAERDPNDLEQGLPEHRRSSSDAERAPALFAALPHEEAEHAMRAEGLPKTAPEENVELSPAAAPRRPLVPSFALPGPSGTVPLPAFAPGPALPFTASGAPAVLVVPEALAAAPTLGTDTVPVFGPPPPARLALGPLPDVGRSARNPSAPSAREPGPPPSGSSLTTRRKGIFSLEQYAALCAEVAVFPQVAEETFARYGLALERKRLSTDLRWQSRLRRNPSEYEEWARFYLHYHALFSEEARTGLRTNPGAP